MDVSSRCSDVVSRREMLSLALQNDHFDIVVSDSAHERRIELVSHSTVLRVVVFGAIHRDPSDAVRRLVSDDIGLFNVIGICFCHSALSPQAFRTPGGLSLSCLARKFSGSNSAMMASCSSVGAGVSATVSATASSNPVFSCTSDNGTPG